MMERNRFRYLSKAMDSTIWAIADLGRPILFTGSCQGGSNEDAGLRQLYHYCDEKEN